jgi:hypothetical protein
MARHFALRMRNKAGNDITQQICKGYEFATYHSIDDNTLRAFTNLYDNALVRFKNDPEKTCMMVGGMGNNTTAEMAALIVVANAILNLDELVTRN